MSGLSGYLRKVLMGNVYHSIDWVIWKTFSIILWRSGTDHEKIDDQYLPEKSVILISLFDIRSYILIILSHIYDN